MLKKSLVLNNNNTSHKPKTKMYLLQKNIIQLFSLILCLRLITDNSK